MELSELQKDCARRQKKGLHFIMASVVRWGIILVSHLTPFSIETKNLITFCSSAVLFPLAWGLAKALKIDFEGKGNPLTKAGIIFSINQMLYILIVMWVFAAGPNKMLMVYAMIFGAHLMPFGVGFSGIRRQRGEDIRARRVLRLEYFLRQTGSALRHSHEHLG